MFAARQTLFAAVEAQPRLILDLAYYFLCEHPMAQESTPSPLLSWLLKPFPITMLIHVDRC